MSETIGRQTASYRQGLVLGLTMAEIMLLLVFCLLIAVGVVLADQRVKLGDAIQHLKQAESAAAADKAMVETIRRNTRLTELLDRATGSASQREIDDFWRKLVESNDLVVNMERQGVSRVALKEETNDLARLHRLRNEGIDPDKIARGVALASAIDEAASAKTIPKLTPQQAAALIAKGIAASDPASESDRGGGHNWPPIINLSEAGGYYFATGSADLTPEFALELRTVVVARLLQIAESFDVDVIEVIGHTDEQPVSNRVSNLDRNMPAVTLGLSAPGPLQWADNAGLGLARALAVVNVLSADPRLRTFRVLPLSGAQLIDTDGRLTRWDGLGDVRERRRIEIRMRKST
jgi:outer membrane protein OmpA-like peptidoglycan-associated protein